MNKILFLLLLLFFVVGCGPNQREYDQTLKKANELESQVESLNIKIKELTAEIEDLKFGPQKLLQKAKFEIQSSRDDEAKKVLDELLKRHSDLPEGKEAVALLKTVEIRIALAENKLKMEEDRKLKEAQAALDRAVKNLARDTDDIKGITWYSHRYQTTLGNNASLYFGTENGSSASYPIRLRIQFSAENWLFVRSLTVKADDKVYELNGLDFKRDNASGSVWEWVDIAVKDHAMINQWMSAKKVVVRFNGDQYYSDFTLPQGQISQMKEVYAAWESMGGRK